MDDWLLIDFLLEDELQISINELDKVQRKWLAEDGLFSVNGNESISTKNQRRKKRPKSKGKQSKSAVYEDIDDSLEDLISLIVKDERFELHVEASSVQEFDTEMKGANKKKKQITNKKKSKHTPSRMDQDRLTYESIARDESFLFNFSMEELAPEPRPKPDVKKGTKTKGKKGPTKGPKTASKLEINHRHVDGEVGAKTESESVSTKVKVKQSKKSVKSESPEHVDKSSRHRARNHGDSKTPQASSNETGKKTKFKASSSKDHHSPAEEKRAPKRLSSKNKKKKDLND
ncbi:uncharacterized protein LALA0_S04e10198g [Lachancea lanzarotensis]|uniref:LALA0S04e10198g1_1 n=1 Tax=Lachancea lanzarotensis TaxID=1245769 RepID=A0A0C7N6M4_9SACH|nr:uncharacterized protein LALA0_S04e10198g [Lachancea lanzarotensis]CEP62204.1 LALA0S04e10198g1_1 [Lachancea lanzarotensis]